MKPLSKPFFRRTPRHGSPIVPFPPPDSDRLVPYVVCLDSSASNIPIGHRSPLQDRDFDLLRTAHSYRLVTTPQYLTLFADGSRVGLYRRLQKLFHHAYLDRIGRNPNAPLVYALARRGAEVLEVSARKEAGDRYVAHQLMVGDFRVALTLAARERGIAFSWRPAGDGLPVKPDGFFSLQFPWLPDGRNRAFFFLEADRSTMPRERFVEKLRAYWAWHQAGSHTEKLGIRRFRVLTVTRSEERLASLLQATADANALPADRPIFWFTSATRLSTEPRMIFEPIWETAARSGERRSVLPTAVQSKMTIPPVESGSRGTAR